MTRQFGKNLSESIRTARGTTLVQRGIFYSTESDDHGARVSTNLPNTTCPRCGAAVDAGIEHLCGNRVPTVQPSKRGKR